ncbi:MAG: hypothetical protein COU09_01175 [Candidatus Harrisonbacteria bacterium CG10_big_fil_rev_8_21_14_0_10_44_23]|uniref:Bacterial type II secretion system protein E domain-containing protein n=1 Tax=Candidatus Harrisonbacteria bacterium CG10_big_fil_rev_8_21_14_0_10_44_23 TaxID=1974585 RepID=A0A2H0UQC8_9BACT|nr:MAG: hypothetical protein COU09_01175 [Candidatus Harrisonbacteria bacterium CG10_big_fil_rev_8_21_14_0_10_44_23]
MISNDEQNLKDKISQVWKSSQERIVKTQASRGNSGYVDLHKVAIVSDSLALINEKIARDLQVASFNKKNHELYLAVYDPAKPGLDQLIKDLQKQGNFVKVFLVSKDSLEYAWTFYRFVTTEEEKGRGRVAISEADVVKLSQAIKSTQQAHDEIDKVIKVSTSDSLEVILAGALALRASDVHFEVSKIGAKIRYRIDGVLQDIDSDINPDSYRLILNRIKLLSSLRLNISGSQDGRFSFAMGDVVIELRVSIIPSEFGETVVMRVLDPRVIRLDLKDLGMRPDDLEIARKEILSPHGMILNTGPTGSGKTTTLYAFLQKVARPELKVITIEDPIEYHLNDIEQTQVDKNRGYTFANGLQAMMRQDPDIILVGEIRDSETAQVAIQAALTGHLVFSTLHTNAASGVIPRLTNLGAPVSSIGPALTLVIAQRLVRQLCPKCKIHLNQDAKTKEKLENFLSTLPERVDRARFSSVDLYKAKDGGCLECNNTGYLGRVGIFELLQVGEDIEGLIEKKAGEAEINQFARKQGMVTLQQDGIIKVLSGITSFEEVEKITGALEWW